jgi:hypothetical protein
MAEGEEKFFNENTSADASAGSESSMNPQIQSDIHEASIFPQRELTKSEQERAAAELEQKRQSREESLQQPEELPGSNPRVRQAQQQMRVISSKIQSIRKQASEKNTQLSRSLKKKKFKEQEAETKLAVKIIRIVIEAISGIGIPIAIWEIVKLAKSGHDIQALKKDQKNIKRNIAQNDVNSRRQENQMEIEMRNLSNILNSEAANLPSQGRRAA